MCALYPLRFWRPERAATPPSVAEPARRSTVLWKSLSNAASELPLRTALYYCKIHHFNQLFTPVAALFSIITRTLRCLIFNFKRHSLFLLRLLCVLSRDRLCFVCILKSINVFNFLFRAKVTYSFWFFHLLLRRLSLFALAAASLFRLNSSPNLRTLFSPLSLLDCRLINTSAFAGQQRHTLFHSLPAACQSLSLSLATHSATKHCKRSVAVRLICYWKDLLKTFVWSNFDRLAPIDDFGQKERCRIKLHLFELVKLTSFFINNTNTRTPL